MGCATPRVSGVEDAAKTKKDVLACNVTYYLKKYYKKNKKNLDFFLNRFKNNFHVVKRELTAEKNTMF